MHIFHAPFHYHVHPIPGKSGCLGIRQGAMEPWCLGKSESALRLTLDFCPNWHPPDLRMTVLLKCHKQPLWSCWNVKCALSQSVFFFFPFRSKRMALMPRSPHTLPKSRPALYWSVAVFRNVTITRLCPPYWKKRNLRCYFWNMSLLNKKKKSFIGVPAPLGYVPGLGRG